MKTTMVVVVGVVALVGVFVAGYATGRWAVPNRAVVIMKDPQPKMNAYSYDVQYAVIVDLDTGRVVGSTSNMSDKVTGRP